MQPVTRACWNSSESPWLVQTPLRLWRSWSNRDVRAYQRHLCAHKLTLTVGHDAERSQTRKDANVFWVFLSSGGITDEKAHCEPSRCQMTHKVKQIDTNLSLVTVATFNLTEHCGVTNPMLNAHKPPSSEYLMSVQRHGTVAMSRPHCDAHQYKPVKLNFHCKGCVTLRLTHTKQRLKQLTMQMREK